ncbi:hypothetical protein Mapa_016194 [Marchantia paleacea]|nr:hypothetical protein Mapa_016194 [Marchantia paleacea]
MEELGAVGQVFDENGKDVTPKPLVQLKPTVLYDKLSQATAGRVSPTNMEAEYIGGAPTLSRTGYSITSSAGSLTPETVEGEEMDRDDGTMSVKSRSLLGTSIGIPEIPKIIQVVMAPVVLPTTQKEKEKIIYVYLHESENFVLLNFKGANYNAAFEGLNVAAERNDRYAKLLELKQGSDNYSHAYAQTLVRLLKKKEVQVWAPSMQSEACQANAWDIHDTISGQKQQDLRDPWAIAQAKKAAELAAADAAQVPSTLPKLYGLMEGPNAPSPIASPQPSRRPSTQGGAQFSRWGSVSGQYSRRQSVSGKISRRGSVSGGVLSRRMSTTASVQVEDLFGKRPGVVGSSVGDGALGSDGLQSARARVFEGDISKLTNLFKSLQVAERALVQNTFHEKVFGFYNGILAIYDTRNPKDASPVVQSGMNSGRHGDPIWKIQWIDSTSEHGESLVSISTDGRVSQWFLKKDLEFVNLIKLKKVSGSSKGEQAQPFISRRAAGMCFDFCPRDPGVYLVGSEEGRVYKCDRSYSEQYMATYVGHTGPVYQVIMAVTVISYDYQEGSRHICSPTFSTPIEVGRKLFLQHF